MTISDRLRNLRLPISVISGPIIWALQLMIGYVLVPVACQTSQSWAVLALGILAACSPLVWGSLLIAAGETM